VAGFRLSVRAEKDLMDICGYTLRTWGEGQASKYIDGLETCCQRVADDPGLGRACDDIRPGLRRMEQGQHVIFYRQEPAGIVILRILHRRMLPERHLADD
jgi:toxin ParE1/3/4